MSKNKISGAFDAGDDKRWIREALLRISLTEAERRDIDGALAEWYTDQLGALESVAGTLGPRRFSVLRGLAGLSRE